MYPQEPQTWWIGLTTPSLCNPLAPMSLEHPVHVLGLIRNDLKYIPVLHHLALFIYAEDVDAGPHVVTRPLLPAVQHDVVTFRDNALELYALTWILARSFLEVGDEAVLSILHTRIVLNVGRASMALDGLARSALVEHQVIERDHVPLIASKSAIT
jgi:hypothetical protein